MGSDEELGQTDLMVVGGHLPRPAAGATGVRAGRAQTGRGTAGVHAQPAESTAVPTTPPRRPALRPVAQRGQWLCLSSLLRILFQFGNITTMLQNKIHYVPSPHALLCFAIISTLMMVEYIYFPVYYLICYMSMNPLVLVALLKIPRGAGAELSPICVCASIVAIIAQFTKYWLQDYCTSFFCLYTTEIFLLGPSVIAIGAYSFLLFRSCQHVISEYLPFLKRKTQYSQLKDYKNVNSDSRKSRDGVHAGFYLRLLLTHNVLCIPILLQLLNSYACVPPLFLRNGGVLLAPSVTKMFETLDMYVLFFF